MTATIVVAITVLYPAFALWQVARTASSRRGKKPLRDRLHLLLAIAVSVNLLLVSRAITDWERIPLVVWPAGLLLTAVAVAVAGRAWPGLRWLDSPRPRLRVVSVTTQLLVAGAVFAVLF